MEAIPGFSNTAELHEEHQNAPNTVHVPSGCEWRFEVPYKTIIVLRILDGIGEIFGTELPINVDIELTGVKYALYAPLHEGCKIQYHTKPNKELSATSSEDAEISEYVSEDTTMSQYINLHFALETRRQDAADRNLSNSMENRKGPKVLVLGNAFSGKTTLCKILSSYAFKMDRMPIYVNLNPRDGVFSLPGSVTATPISDNFDLQAVGGFGSTTTSGTTHHNPKQPLVKNYGFEDYQANLDLYKYQISKLGLAVLSRLEEDPQAKSSGAIIDTPAFSMKDSTIIENIISDFEIDVVVVIGNERLVVNLKRKFTHRLANAQLVIVKVPKSEGVVEVEDSYIRKTQEETIKQYFNGTSANPLSPFKTEINISDFTFYKGVETAEYNSSLLFAPSGDSFTPENADENKEDTLEKYYKKIDDFSSTNLENLLVAITQTPQIKVANKELLNTCVLGYIHVSKYEESKNKLKVLMPMPGAFPRNALIATSIGYTE